jgi:nicotinamidase-related amidase
MDDSRQRDALIVVPDCESNIARLIGLWRAQSGPVVFVRHDSSSPESPLHPDAPGNAFKVELGGGSDLLVVKHTNSAFYGAPDLHAWLQQHDCDAVTICGITTNHCCETTARMAGNFGYRTTFVIDATSTFDRRDLDGAIISAEEISRVTAANPDGEFAVVRRTQELLDDHESSPTAPVAAP